MTHYFSSCQGELTEQTFFVKAVDAEGNVLVEQAATALKNGFMELWLPRNRRISLEIKRGDLIAQGVIETFPDSKTCVTTFQLR
ncbi:MAG: CueP family metal-binding protein [Syntrophobacterales bacterium]|nr:CueP family metal-binding protein [Syntrophobacterales bacterium]